MASPCWSDHPLVNARLGAMRHVDMGPPLCKTKTVELPRWLSVFDPRLGTSAFQISIARWKSRCSQTVSVSTDPDPPTPQSVSSAGLSGYPRWHSRASASSRTLVEIGKS
jgi:hypothetical protein